LSEIFLVFHPLQHTAIYCQHYNRPRVADDTKRPTLFDVTTAKEPGCFCPGMHFVALLNINVTSLV